MHDGDVEIRDKPALDLEAVGRADVLEVDAAEAAGDPLHRVDERVGVVGVDEDRHGGDAGKLAVEHRLSLHDGHGCDRADVAEAEDARAVGADRDGAPDHGEAMGEGRLVGDREADAGDSRRVGVAHVLQGLHLVRGDDGELAALVRMEGAVPEGDDTDSLDLVELGGDPLGLLVVSHLDGDLADRAVAPDRHRVDVADEAGRIGDLGAHLGELARHVGLFDPVDVVDRHRAGD